ncbi:MAG: hypothetical protein GXP49_16715 [Deltaproteobacteria bacterium]|nr:hypothetical protein [Deltaproteobacteria bacterium]
MKRLTLTIAVLFSISLLPAVSHALDPKTRSRVAMAIDTLGGKLAKAFKKLPGKSKFQWLAVNPFIAKGKIAKDKELGALVTAELTTYFHRDKGFNIVERQRLNDAIEEMALAQTGLLEDEGKAAKVGKMVGADAIVVGSVADAGDKFLVNARIISTEQATVLVADNVEIQAADLIALSAEAVVLKSKSGALFRALTPIASWGQWYNDDIVKAIVFTSAQVLSLTGAAIFWSRGYMAEQKYNWIPSGFNIAQGQPGYRDDYDVPCDGGNCPTTWGPSRQGNGPACSSGSGSGPNGECTLRDWYKHRIGAHTVLRKEAQDEYLRGNIMIGVWAGVFAISILDAYLSGKNYTYDDALAHDGSTGIIPWAGVTPSGDKQVGLSWGFHF